MDVLTDIISPLKTSEKNKGQQVPHSSVPQIRVVFMGTPELSRELLSFLCETGYNIVGVVTKTPKEIGRKHTLTASPVHQFAKEHSIPLLTPKKLDDDFFSVLKKQWQPDLIIVAAYGKILPEKILTLPAFGCVNIHYSLLPKHRGASPIQNALLYGDTETGVTLMQMDAGLDTGDIITTLSLSIHPDDTTATLTPKLNALAKELLDTSLPAYIQREIPSTKQDTNEATLCQLIERSDGKVIWEEDAQTIYNRYRALTPWPGIYTFQKKHTSSGEEFFLRIKLLSVQPLAQGSISPGLLGQVIETPQGIGVQTSKDILLLQSIQPENKKPMSPADFANGNPDFLGSFLV